MGMNIASGLYKAAIATALKLTNNHPTKIGQALIRLASQFRTASHTEENLSTKINKAKTEQSNFLLKSEAFQAALIHVDNIDLFDGTKPNALETNPDKSVTNLKNTLSEIKDKALMMNLQEFGISDSKASTEEDYAALSKQFADGKKIANDLDKSIRETKSLQKDMQNLKTFNTRLTGRN